MQEVFIHNDTPCQRQSCQHPASSHYPEGCSLCNCARNRRTIEAIAVAGDDDAEAVRA